MMSILCLRALFFFPRAVKFLCDCCTVSTENIIIQNRRLHSLQLVGSICDFPSSATPYKETFSAVLSLSWTVVV